MKDVRKLCLSAETIGAREEREMFCFSKHLLLCMAPQWSQATHLDNSLTMQEVEKAVKQLLCFYYAFMI